MDETNLIPMTPAAQTENNPNLYKMSMRFTLHMQLKVLEDVITGCGIKNGLTSTQTATIEQTVPFIPDDETIETYKNIIKENYNHPDNKIEIQNVTFDGYDYLYRVEPKRLKRIVVLGGSFNPPTYAHKELMDSILAELNAEKGIYVPSSNTYVTRKCKKNNTPFIFSETERLEMLNDLCKTDWTEVSTCEYGDTSKGRTHETLIQIQKQYPEHEIVFIMGSDKLNILPKWKLADMLEQFKIAVITRGNDHPEEQIDAIPKLRKNKHAFLILPTLNDHGEASSSSVQEFYWHMSLKTDTQFWNNKCEHVTQHTHDMIIQHITQKNM